MDLYIQVLPVTVYIRYIKACDSKANNIQNWKFLPDCIVNAKNFQYIESGLLSASLTVNFLHLI